MRPTGLTSQFDRPDPPAAAVHVHPSVCSYYGKTAAAVSQGAMVRGRATDVPSWADGEGLRLIA